MDERQIAFALSQFGQGLATITEAAAIAAARFRGHGDEAAAEQAAIAAMHDALAALPVSATIVIGEGSNDDTSMLFHGEKLGTGGISVDVAVDSLEGTTICAKALPNALSVIAVAPHGGFLRVPDLYMDKIAIGPGYPPGVVDPDAPVRDNLCALAKAKGVPVGELVACVLDRPRHGRLIGEIRDLGVAIRLIGDGDIGGVIDSTQPDVTGIDIYLGLGGAAEGVLAAAALRSTGGQMLARLVPQNADQRAVAAAHGLTDLKHIYTLDELAPGDALFAATGITSGSLLDGVRVADGAVETHSVVMNAAERTVRWISSEYHAPGE